MSIFEYVSGSHERYPEDEYNAESLVLCFDGKYRVPYVRKKMKNGGMFWDVVSASVTQFGKKKFLKGFSQDSNFLAEDIKHFLDNRVWEKGGRIAEKEDQLPF
jgi:hypothetical protein